MTISDNGAFIAIAGRGLGIKLYSVAEDCGDTLQFGERGPMPVSTECSSIPINSHGLFPAFHWATSPRLLGGVKARLAVEVRQGLLVSSVLIGSSDEGEDSKKEGYVALGDSFTSGEGEIDDAFYQPGTNTGVHKCHLSTRSYPYLLGTAWAMPHSSVACSGAQTNDILGGAGYLGQGERLRSVDAASLASVRDTALRQGNPGVLPQIEFVKDRLPQVVTLGIGGNDAGLMGKLSICITKATCEWAEPGEKRLAAAKEVQAVGKKLQDAYRKILKENPGVILYAVGYPRVVNVGDDETCGMVVSTVLNKKERIFIDEIVKVLNDTIRTAAAKEGVRYLPIDTALDGDRICDKGSAGMSAVRLGDDIAPIGSLPKLKLFGAESFHPTPYGHSRIATALLAQIGEGGVPRESASASRQLLQRLSEEGDLSEYWTEGIVNTSHNEPFLSKEAGTPVQIRTAQDPLAVHAPAYTFAPEQPVEVWLNDTQLEVLSADSDGGMRYEWVPPRETGDGNYMISLTGRAYTEGQRQVYRVAEVRIEEEQRAEEEEGQNESDEEDATGAGAEDGVDPVIPTGDSEQTPENTLPEYKSDTPSVIETLTPPLKEAPRWRASQSTQPYRTISFAEPLFLRPSPRYIQPQQDALGVATPPRMLQKQASISTKDSKRTGLPYAFLIGIGLAGALLMSLAILLWVLASKRIRKEAV